MQRFLAETLPHEHSFAAELITKLFAKCILSIPAKLDPLTKHA